MARQVQELRGEREELNEEISEAQAAAAGASATQAGLFDDLQAEVESAEEEIAAAQEAQKAIRAEKEKVCVDGVGVRGAWGVVGGGLTGSAYRMCMFRF